MCCLAGAHRHQTWLESPYKVFGVFLRGRRYALHPCAEQPSSPCFHGVPSAVRKSRLTSSKQPEAVRLVKQPAMLTSTVSEARPRATCCRRDSKIFCESARFARGGRTSPGGCSDTRTSLRPRGHIVQFTPTEVCRTRLLMFVSLNGHQRKPS